MYSFKLKTLITSQPTHMRSSVQLLINQSLPSLFLPQHMDRCLQLNLHTHNLLFRSQIIQPQMLTEHIHNITVRSVQQPVRIRHQRALVHLCPLDLNHEQRLV